MYTVYEQQPLAIPWRIGYYSLWNHLNWPLFKRQGLNYQLTDLKKRRSTKNVLLVPLSNLIDDYNTQTVLPTLLENMVSIFFNDFYSEFV